MHSKNSKRTIAIFNKIIYLINYTTTPRDGTIAQLVERMNGIHEATGSIPVSSTTIFKKLL